MFFRHYLKKTKKIGLVDLCQGIEAGFCVKTEQNGKRQFRGK
jgi:hypothetical protein